MAKENEPIQIIGNESNTVYEIEPDKTSDALQANTTAEKEKIEQPDANFSTGESQRINNDLATNDGSIVETLDTAFHNKPGVAEGENLSGSDRADYYEARSQGKSDAEEEVR